MKANAIRVAYTKGGLMEITLTTPKTHQTEQEVAGAEEIIAKGKELEVKIKKYIKERSLNANSYFWALTGKVAEVLKSSPDEVYIEMLKRYGQREPELLSVIAEAGEMVYRATKNHCCEVGESELNNKTFKHFAILKGSSGYNSVEMARLIEGIISECKDLNIETITENERLKMLSEWGNRQC
jgi:hypothetical protein